MRSLSTDVFVVGTGPAGCVYPRVLVPRGHRVVMADAGAVFSERPGENLKNQFVYQQRPDRFADLVRGLLHPLSRSPDPSRGSGATESLNPRQDPAKNLDEAATAYAVGGMAIHWTCVIPRQHESERSDALTSEEWERAYTEAEAVLKMNDQLYRSSVRHCVVKEALVEAYDGRLDPTRPVSDLPMAVEPHPGGDGMVRFVGTDDVLEPLLDREVPTDRFRILAEHCVRQLKVEGGKVVAAEVWDLRRREPLEVRAEKFVVAAGTVLSAQLLHNSGIRPAALGRYLTEHPMLFAQVILSEPVQARLREHPGFDEARRNASFNDRLRLPPHDLPPNVWIPVNASRPWHAQICKEVVHFSQIPPGVDDRLVTDLRWYAAMDARPENRVKFEDDLRDPLGMPQPTFEFELSSKDRERMAQMEVDLRSAASALGPFAPGSEPRALPLGTCLHLQGACRMGLKDDGTSVVDRDLRVWGFDNLYVAGNSVIASTNACNPTLTSLALALRSAQRLATGSA